VLRFWESKFPQLKPLKRGGGRRYYRPEDVLLLRHIRQCLYQDGYTIKGVQKLLREGGRPAEGAQPAGPRTGQAAKSPTLFPAAPALPSKTGPGPVRAPDRHPPLRDPTQAALEELRSELLAIRALLGELYDIAPRSSED